MDIKELDNMIFALFIRWLKANNLYFLFRKGCGCQEFYTPTFTWEKWMTHNVHPKYLHVKDKFMGYASLVSEAPFNWVKETQPCTYNITTHGGFNRWCDITSEWHRFLTNLEPSIKDKIS